MTTFTSAFGKANACGNLKLAQVHCTRLYSTAPAPKPVNGHASQPKSADHATQRELFMNVLNANATKRDAKQYLARFKPPKGSDTKVTKLSKFEQERNAQSRKDQDRLDRMGVNLGGLYAPARAISESPQFIQKHVEEKASAQPREYLHTALVCLRAPQALDDETLDGVARTLSQLVKLDMRIVLLLALDNPSALQTGPSHNANDLKAVRETFAKQGDRLIHAIARHSSHGARVVSDTIETFDGPQSEGNQVSVVLPKLILGPLERSVIPIIPTLVYTNSGRLVNASTSSVMSALTRLLSNLPSDASSAPRKESIVQTSLDRIILLDNAGGIPSKDRGDDSHVFINLEQEFDEIDAELEEYGRMPNKAGQAPGLLDIYERHRANLRILKDCLAILPSATSALIVTPQEAASSSQSNPQDATIGAGTRRQKNSLIHNLLTNKPLVSPSLPVARLPHISNGNSDFAHVEVPSATLVKHGMPLAIIPSAPRGSGWEAPTSGETTLDLEHDPQIDLPRLTHLIEDSFRRKIDMRHYLDRIHGRTAGLIVAGAYEGAAILTWEQPPHTTDPGRPVPYLDKFAVLSSSQGSSGVADILFQAMVRKCFPQGVCWRSRKDNPVNKWYFERADGHWRIPGTNWTMFWTGDGVVEDRRRWEDYVGVCESVGPSWADGKKPD